MDHDHLPEYGRVVPVTAFLRPGHDQFLISPSRDIRFFNGHATVNPADCASASVAKMPLTQVQLTFGPCSGLATPPVTAAVVVTPAPPGAAPVQITVAVHRLVSWWQYAWYPLVCGVVLALLVVATVLAIGCRTRPGAGPPRVRFKRVWARPLYASAAWTFSGSWTTNVTAAGAVVAGVLTATGAVSELLPGLELGRFSLLIVAALLASRSPRPWCSAR